MVEKDSIPAARLVWMRLVLGIGHPVAVIVVVLALVGAGICWFSYEKISSLSKTPTRYRMEVVLSTEGCADREFRLEGDIGSFGPSFFSLPFYDSEDRPILGRECRVKAIRLSSNLPLTPVQYRESTQLIRVTGAEVDTLLEQEGASVGSYYRDEVTQTFRATVVNGELAAIGGATGESGPDFSMGSEEDGTPTDVAEQKTHHDVVFSDKWQPLFAWFSFRVPENVKTYFDVFAFQRVPRTPEEAEAMRWPWAIEPIDVSLSFRTDDVSVVRGAMLDSGDATGIDGYIRFGLENNDAESRRESGNVTYSAVLGIGIALLVEAFVIVLAVAVRRLVSRPARASGSEGR